MGECQHRDLRDARRKAAKEIQETARGLFLKRIKDRAGRLPNWELLYAITSEDTPCCRPGEPQLSVAFKQSQFVN